MGAGEHIARKGTKGDGPKGAFVMEVAKFLGLDPEHVSRTYVRRLEKTHGERTGL